MQRPGTVTRISDAVAAELETRILEGALKPGDRLPAERELSVEMGVSRPSLREAIHKLVNKGLLTTRHGGGTFVTDRLEAPFVDPWKEMLSAHPNLQGDMLEFRYLLEGEAAALAAERATDLDIERLDAAFAAMSAAYARNDIPESVRTDVVFHQTIAEAAHNVVIGHLTASLLQVIQEHVSGNIEYLHQRPPHWAALESQHKAIWLAIRERQPDVAARAARDHIEFVRQTMADNARAVERRYSALRRL